jgi:hypothetical protein
VVALLFVALQLSMLGSALLFGLLLTDFSQMRLIQVIQGAAVLPSCSTSSRSGNRSSGTATARPR